MFMLFYFFNTTNFSPNIYNLITLTKVFETSMVDPAADKNELKRLRHKLSFTSISNL